MNLDIANSSNWHPVLYTWESLPCLKFSSSLLPAPQSLIISSSKKLAPARTSSENGLVYQVGNICASNFFLHHHFCSCHTPFMVKIMSLWDFWHVYASLKTKTNLPLDLKILIAYKPNLDWKFIKKFKESKKSINKTYLKLSA